MPALALALERQINAIFQAFLLLFQFRERSLDFRRTKLYNIDAGMHIKAIFLHRSF